MGKVRQIPLVPDRNWLEQRLYPWWMIRYYSAHKNVSGTKYCADVNYTITVVRDAIQQEEAEIVIEVVPLRLYGTKGGRVMPMKEKRGNGVRTTITLMRTDLDDRNPSEGDFDYITCNPQHTLQSVDAITNYIDIEDPGTGTTLPELEDLIYDYSPWRNFNE
jgi:hypothetical protein